MGGNWSLFQGGETRQLNLRPPIDKHYTVELGHTNYQLGKDGKQGIRNLTADPSEPEPPATTIPPDDGSNVFDWHFDAYPFVA